MNKNDDMVLLMKLRECKDEFISSLNEDLNIPENYKSAREKYKKYRDIYYEITKKEPKNNFEYLINKAGFNEKNNI